MTYAILAGQVVSDHHRVELEPLVVDPEWMRFFALMGAEVAVREGQPLVPDTPAEAATRRSEVRRLAATLRVVERLTAYGETVRVLEERKSGRKSVTSFSTWTSGEGC